MPITSKNSYLVFDGHLSSYKDGGSNFDPGHGDLFKIEKTEIVGKDLRVLVLKEIPTMASAEKPEKLVTCYKAPGNNPAFIVAPGLINRGLEGLANYRCAVLLLNKHNTYSTLKKVAEIACGIKFFVAELRDTQNHEYLKAIKFLPDSNRDLRQALSEIFSTDQKKQ